MSRPLPGETPFESLDGEQKVIVVAIIAAAVVLVTLIVCSAVVGHAL